MGDVVDADEEVDEEEEEVVEDGVAEDLNDLSWCG